MATGRTDRASRIVRASPELIYRAFQSGEAWAEWLPPDGMTARIETFDFRPGGRYRLVLTYRDAAHATLGKTSSDTDAVEGRFVELVPDRLVVQEVEFVSDDPAFAGMMRMRWSLQAVPEGTEVAITCENVPRGIDAKDHDQGLRATLANLATFAEDRRDGRKLDL